MPARPLLQLLRPPNLFTVPGDPLCGALLASHGAWSWRILPAVAVSLCAYCAGLVVNDLADFDEDLRERPTRPLPSGAVSRRTAAALALLFALAALAAAASVNGGVLILAILLLAQILFYDLVARKIPLVAPLAMGLCRGLSVLAGAAAFPTLYILHFISGRSSNRTFTFHPGHFGTALLAAGVITLYIAGVTALARTETRNPRIPPLIGALIRGLLFIQAGFCALAGGVGWAAGLLLLALWPVSRLVASHFYAS